MENGKQGITVSNDSSYQQFSGKGVTHMSDMMQNQSSSQQLEERVLSKELIYDGAVVHLEKWRVTLPDGKAVSREVILHPGAAAVVAINDNKEIYLVRQYRTPIGRVTTEIPAGKLDQGEDPLACAKRELSEETGLEAVQWQKLTALETTVGFCNECIHIYLATGLKQFASHTDEGEFLSVTRMPLADAVSRVTAGEFQDGKTALGILLVHQLLCKP